MALDARPDRLDLPPPLLRAAVRAGAGVVVGSDAHSPVELAFLDELGAGLSRRGGVPRTSVWNALPLPAFCKKPKRNR
ncbi:MAG: hypothetical protein FJ086_17165 [Deltaproteobacteria bacterium]|nr:hypothetical protein [Deltaproteobacteria bacterium]